MFSILASWQQTGGVAPATNLVCDRPGFATVMQWNWRMGARAGWCGAWKQCAPAARSFIQLALILGLAFIESLVLFTLVIIFVKVA